MFIRRLTGWALAGVAAGGLQAATVSQDFSSDPVLAGWQVFGDPDLFHWNSLNQNLEVTWDSRRPNSYYFHPLGQELTRFDDFRIEFDLTLRDAASGIEPNKTTPLQIGIGLLNYADAVSPGFLRGTGQATNVAEFAYYTAGSYEWGGVIYPSDPAAVPSFVSSGEVLRYAPAFVYPYALALPTQAVVHVSLAYAGGSQTAVLSVASNGVAVGPLPPLALTDRAQSQFGPCDTFVVDTFSITSYTGIGDDWNSLLAHGTVDNVVLRTQMHPGPILSASATPEGYWQVECFSRRDWLYWLERTTNMVSWPELIGPVPGVNGCITLQDSDPPPGGACYRVKAMAP